MATKPIEAKYNHGVIEPMESLDLHEGERIEIIIRRDVKKQAKPKRHYLDVIQKFEFDSGEDDLSVNHDKYLYDNPHGL